MVEEEYVSYKAAKLLKEKGFNITCNSLYVVTNDKPVRWDSYESDYLPATNKLLDSTPVFQKKWIDHCSCPTQQLVCRWLREVHHLHIVAFCPLVDMDAKEYGVTYNLVISDLNNECLAVDTGLEDIEYNSYELAIQEGIEYCLEHLI